MLAGGFGSGSGVFRSLCGSERSRRISWMTMASAIGVVGPASEKMSEAAREKSEKKQMEDEEMKDLNHINNITDHKKEKSKKESYYIPRFRCFRIEKDEKGNFDMEVVDSFEVRGNPTHLLVMVNGLIGSADNWKFAAKQFLKVYPGELIVHCSKCNPASMTFDGVDKMGCRLAEEVVSVINRHPDVKKISFISHSLGGLVARYAIAKLYDRNDCREHNHENGESEINKSTDQCLEQNSKGKIAGLEPINFITCATPHLGSRGHKQVPAFCGFYPLEKAACHTAWFLGRTGKHLFLTDGKNGKPPLLLRMVSDGEDLKFLSALHSFTRRVAYANVCFDHLVGWSTSSLRRHDELPKKKNLSRDNNYKHIVNLEAGIFVEARVENPLDGKDDDSVDIDMQEKMIRALTKMKWDRVDVDFSRSKQRYLAHSTIQVKTYCFNSDGKHVIQHMIDNFLV